MTSWQKPNMKGCICFPLGASLFTCREVGKWGKCRSILGPTFENVRVVQKVGSGRIKGDVGCDRMVFAIDSDIILMKSNSFFNKWSLDQGQKTTNPLILYSFPYSTLGGSGNDRVLDRQVHAIWQNLIKHHNCSKNLIQK